MSMKMSQSYKHQLGYDSHGNPNLKNAKNEWQRLRNNKATRDTVSETFDPNAIIKYLAKRDDRPDLLDRLSLSADAKAKPKASGAHAAPHGPKPVAKKAAMPAPKPVAKKASTPAPAAKPVKQPEASPVSWVRVALASERVKDFANLFENDKATFEASGQVGYILSKVTKAFAGTNMTIASASHKMELQLRKVALGEGLGHGSASGLDAINIGGGLKGLFNVFNSQKNRLTQSQKNLIDRAIVAIGAKVGDVAAKVHDPNATVAAAFSHRDEMVDLAHRSVNHFRNINDNVGYIATQQAAAKVRPQFGPALMALAADARSLDLLRATRGVTDKLDAVRLGRSSIAASAIGTDIKALFELYDKRKGAMPPKQREALEKVMVGIGQTLQGIAKNHGAV